MRTGGRQRSHHFNRYLNEVLMSASLMLAAVSFSSHYPAPNHYLHSLVRMFGQSIGPIFGGILTQFFGFHSIFWALTALGGLSLLLIVVFLPETLRSIAGDGTVPVSGSHKPLLYFLRPQPHAIEGSEPT